MVLSLVKGLDRERFRPVVCCLTEPGALAASVEALGVPLLALGKHPHFDLPVIPRLAAVLRKHDVRLLHSHVWPANVWGRVVGRLTRRPHLVVTEHNVDLWKGRTHFAVDRFLARFTDRVLCVSRAVEEFYRDVVGIPAEKLLYLPNGIDPTPFAGGPDGASTRRDLSLTEERPVVTVVARLLPQKDHRTLLSALRLLKDRGAAVSCLVVGDGALRQELEARARELSLDGGVKFLGERLDVAKLLLASDVFALSSIHEGMPLAVLEAMAAAKPVVVTDVGGNGEIVRNGETGFVVPPRDPAALADALARLTSSPELAKRMGAAGRDRVNREFTLEAMVRRNEEVYEELLARG